MDLLIISFTAGWDPNRMCTCIFSCLYVFSVYEALKLKENCLALEDHSHQVGAIHSELAVHYFELKGSCLDLSRTID